MTKEELLKPRYKVIALYPGSEDWETIGAIIELPDSRHKYSDGILCGFDYFDYYPNIYERMHWSSEREPDDMPKYVGANNEQGTFNWVHPIVKWVNTDNRSKPLSCIISFTNLQGEYEEREMNQFGLLPATAEDYPAYLQTIKNNQRWKIQ